MQNKKIRKMNKKPPSILPESFPQKTFSASKKKAVLRKTSFLQIMHDRNYLKQHNELITTHPRTSKLSFPPHSKRLFKDKKIFFFKGKSLFHEKSPLKVLGALLESLTRTIQNNELPLAEQKNKIQK